MIELIQDYHQHKASFPQIPGDVHWQHSANTPLAFCTAAHDKNIHAIETDFSCNDKGIIIAYHPLENDALAHSTGFHSELTLSDALALAPQFYKIYKFDIKNQKVLKYLHTQARMPLFSVIINADVFQGMHAHQPIIDPHYFFDMCSDMPDIIVSPGFTTNDNPEGVYSGGDIEQLIRSCEHTNHATFPVRLDWVAFKPESWQAVTMFLQHNPHYSLTFWNGSIVTNDMLKWLKDNTDPKRTTYDIYDFTTLDKKPIFLNQY